MDWDFILGLLCGAGLMLIFMLFVASSKDEPEQRYYYRPPRREVDLAVREQGEVITHVSFDVKEVR